MKSLTKISLVAVAVLITFTTMANDPNSNSTIVQKAIENVKNAEPTDWETFAESAEICYMKKENMADAFRWIDKSLSIKETAYNLEVKGDFLRYMNQRPEAIAYYLKAIIKAKETNPTADYSRLQSKIWVLR